MTYRCPLHCVYCSNPLDFAKVEEELSTEDWKRVFREARALGAVQLGFSGGEPLVRDDLPALVQEAHSLGFYTNLITSGVGLNENRIGQLRAAGLDHIQVSFQDSTKEVNDFLSSTRTFELKLKVARLVKGHGYPMVLNVVLSRLNIDHIDKIIEMALALDADFLELANTQYYGWAYLNRDQLLAQPCADRARRASHQRLSREGGLADEDVLRRAGLLRRPSQGVHERLGLGVPHHRSRRSRAPVPGRANAARTRVSERARARAWRRSGTTHPRSTRTVARAGCASPAVPAPSAPRILAAAAARLTC